MSFTPGPWGIIHEFNIEQIKSGRCIATAGGYSDNTEVEKAHNENVANAVLISAAPDLLEACLSAIDYLHDDPNDNNDSELTRACKLMRSAIAKAEGK